MVASKQWYYGLVIWYLIYKHNCCSSLATRDLLSHETTLEIICNGRQHGLMHDFHKQIKYYCILDFIVAIFPPLCNRHFLASYKLSRSSISVLFFTLHLLILSIWNSWQFPLREELRLRFLCRLHCYLGLLKTKDWKHLILHYRHSTENSWSKSMCFPTSFGFNPEPSK